MRGDGITMRKPAFQVIVLVSAPVLDEGFETSVFYELVVSHHPHRSEYDGVVALSGLSLDTVHVYMLFFD
jgi:hypothetical protein